MDTLYTKQFYKIKTNMIGYLARTIAETLEERCEDEFILFQLEKFKSLSHELIQGSIKERVNPFTSEVNAWDAKRKSTLVLLRSSLNNIIQAYLVDPAKVEGASAIKVLMSIFDPKILTKGYTKRTSQISLFLSRIDSMDPELRSSAGIDPILDFLRETNIEFESAVDKRTMHFAELPKLRMQKEIRDEITERLELLCLYVARNDLDFPGKYHEVARILLNAISDMLTTTRMSGPRKKKETSVGEVLIEDQGEILNLGEEEEICSEDE